jgi:signal transduction histidine kinase
MLDIEDTGIGIAQKEIPHIFDRFYQADTSRANQGFGLGLALVKRIVDLHGWRISVKSIEGKGATFSVEF